MRTKFFNQRLDAFTLTELLIVLVIIGILVLLALPNLMPAVSDARATEAKMQLSHVAKLQKTYFMEYTRYSDNFEALGFEHNKLVDDGGTANYRIEIVEAAEGGFKATATAVRDFDGDGVFNTWEVSQDGIPKELQKD